MTNKLDVRQRMTLPAKVAEFLDELQQERRLASRRDVVLQILRDAMRRHRHAAATARMRARQKQAAASGHSAAKG